MKKLNKILMICLLLFLVALFLNSIKKSQTKVLKDVEILNTDEKSKSSVLYTKKELEIQSNILSQDIPIFMYHSVTDDLSYIEYPINAVTVKNFENQLIAIKAGGYETIFVSDLKNSAKYDKPLLLTFDDGFKDFYFNVFALLKKYNMKATLFAMYGFRNEKYYCNIEQLKELQESNLVQVESHTISHANLKNCSDDVLLNEVVNSKKLLNENAGTNCTAICYPYGQYSFKALSLVREHYIYGIAMQEGLYNTQKHSLYEIPRFSVTRYTSLDTFKNNIKKSHKYYRN